MLHLCLLKPETGSSVRLPLGVKVNGNASASSGDGVCGSVGQKYRKNGVLELTALLMKSLAWLGCIVGFGTKDMEKE